LLYEPADIEALTSHLAVLADPLQRQAMGEAARQSVHRTFTVERMMAAFTCELLALDSLPA
jgi:hypothetical protein